MTFDRSLEAKRKRWGLIYGAGKAAFVRGCEAVKTSELLTDADMGESEARCVAHCDEYDGSYVENHCPECGEYESECTCGEG